MKFAIKFAPHAPVAHGVKFAGMIIVSSLKIWSRCKVCHKVCTACIRGTRCEVCKHDFRFLGVNIQFAIKFAPHAPVAHGVKFASMMVSSRRERDFGDKYEGTDVLEH